VLGTGWFAAVAAEVGPGKMVAVVGDGAVGLLAVLAAQQLGADRIIAMSRHEPRQKLAMEYGPPTSSPSAATTVWPGSRIAAATPGLPGGYRLIDPAPPPGGASYRGLASALAHGFNLSVDTG
jgi:threonine dehydrogenase-like Zn-dependent dehydrogenase